MTSTTLSPTTAPVGGRRAAPTWLALAIVLTGTFVVTLDFFIVTVAFPATQLDLAATAGAMQLVMAAYGIALAVGLVLGGRLGDRFGRRRIFALGLALFTVASAVCGAAPNVELLIAGRIVQGIGAALLSPQALAIIGVAYEGEARMRAFALYGVVMGLAAASGQLVGGVLIELDVAGLDWRTVYLVNVPIGIVALALVPRALKESRDARGDRLDLGGAALLMLALVAIVLPLVLGREHGWPLWTWLCLGAAVPLLAAFALLQRRLAARGGAPLVPPVLFRERAFTVGLLASVVFYIGMGSFFVYFAIYLQLGRGMDALGSELVFTPLAVGYLAASIASEKLAPKLGKQVLALGGVVRAVGLAGLGLTIAAIGADGSAVLLVPALVVDGIGMGLLTAPLIATVLAGMSERHAGAATGVLATAQQIGIAVGVAIVGVVFYEGMGPEAQATPDDVEHAFLLVLAVVAGVSVAVALLVQALGGRRAATGE